MVKQELNLIIIWENARKLQEDILKDLSKSFQVCEYIEIQWDKNKFHQNLTRFYGQKLPDGSFKEKHCGNGAFLLVILIDKNPYYAYRATSKGKELVNTRIFDKKVLYRKWTGGGHKIHATNGLHETNHDLMLLLGKDVNTYLKDYYLAKEERPKKITQLNKNLEGSDGWDSFDHLFKILNACVDYVVMRNFEKLPHSYRVDEHGDIDFLCDNMLEMAYLLNGCKTKPITRPSAYQIKVAEENIPCDIRCIGDGYYDKQWQIDILQKSKIFQGFKVPSDQDYITMLLYHAYLHKTRLSKSYEEIFQQYDIPAKEAIIFLRNFMQKKGYNIELPSDISVYFNFRNGQKLHIKQKKYNWFKLITRSMRQFFLVDTRLTIKRLYEKWQSYHGN